MVKKIFSAPELSDQVGTEAVAGLALPIEVQAIICGHLQPILPLYEESRKEEWRYGGHPFVSM